MANSETAGNKKKWFDGLKAEFKKIIWTDRPTLIKQTIAVIIISAIICVIISIVDSVALQLMQLIL